jgi:alpha-D-ribose 1-methylphosphonate 5-triphosphate synthase subunit PhnL
MRKILIFTLLMAVGCERSIPQEVPPKAVINIPLDTISLEKARDLDGKKVTASLLIAKPMWMLATKTVVGGPDQLDGIDRGIVLDGERYDLNEGKRITVTGRIYVIDHPPAQVGTVFVPAWTEIRVEQLK